MPKPTQVDSRTKVSVFLEQETHFKAKDAAARAKKSLSQYIAELVQKSLKHKAAA